MRAAVREKNTYYSTKFRWRQDEIWTFFARRLPNKRGARTISGSGYRDIPDAAIIAIGSLSTVGPYECRSGWLARRLKHMSFRVSVTELTCLAYVLSRFFSAQFGHQPKKDNDSTLSSIDNRM